MKYLILFLASCIVIGYIPSGFAQSGMILSKPSLTLQMKKNTIQSKKVQKQTKILANQKKLEDIQRRQQSRKYASSNTGSVKSISTPIVSIQYPTLQKPITSTKDLHSAPSVQLSNNPLSIDRVDVSRVRDTWLSWYNSSRKTLGLSGYIYDTRLDKTAYDWNRIFASGRGLNHHTRTPGDGYYNFDKIDAWFMARGIDPKVIGRSKHTENVGYGYYICNQSDCTDELISAIRSTFDFYMSEKGKSYDAHYRSIVNPYFTKIGMDIIVVPNEKRYYLTVHYITE